MLRNTALSILLLSVLLLVGCSRVHQAKQAMQAGRQLQQTGKTTIKTDEGELQIDTDKGAQQATITVDDESGEKHSITVGKDIDTSGLSLAIYPGATKEGGHVVTTAEGKQLNFVFTTTDSFEKVADFYNAKYSDANISDIKMPDGRLLNIGIGEPPNMTSVAVQQSKDEPNVSIILIEQK